MNEEESYFRRVETYSFSTLTRITQPNMKGFLVVPGIDGSGNQATLNLTVLSPTGTESNVAHKAISTFDPSYNLSAAGLNAGIGILEDNSILLSNAGVITTTFYPMLLVAADPAYPDHTVGTNCKIHVFF